MTKRNRSKPHKGDTKTDQRNADANGHAIVNHANTLPSDKAANLDKSNDREKRDPPTPSGFLTLIGDWLRSRKNAPREKSKAADWTIAVLTIGIAIAAFWSAFIFQWQLREARRATEIQERPWLSIEATPVNGLTFVNGKQAVLVLKFSITNVGHSIAKSIQLDAKMFPAAARMLAAPDATERQRELCDRPKISQVGSFDLFPVDQPAVRELDISAIPSEIEKQSVSIPGSKTRNFVGFYVVGCATYRSSFSPDFHQTRFSYHLIGPNIFAQDGKPLMLNGMPIMNAFEIGVDVPKEKLGMWQELFGQNEAN